MGYTQPAASGCLFMAFPDKTCNGKRSAEVADDAVPSTGAGAARVAVPGAASGGGAPGADPAVASDAASGAALDAGAPAA